MAGLQEDTSSDTSRPASDWVDVAKGIGILLVVFGHVDRGLRGASIGGGLTFRELADSVIYAFHMPLFFFLSGLFFVQSLDRRGARGLLLRKVDTIVYPYLLWSVVQGGVEVALSGHKNSATSVSEVFTLWVPRAQFWFLAALFLLFLITTPIFARLERKVALGVTLGTAVPLYLLQTSLPPGFVFRFIADNLVFFAAGIAFREALGKREMGGPAMLSALLALAVAGQTVFHGPLGLTYVVKGVFSLAVAVVCIAALVSLSQWITRRSGRISSGLAMLGGASMGIYLLHILAGSGTRVVLQRVGGVENYLVQLLAGMAAGTLVPLAVVLAVRRRGIPFVFSAPISRGLARATNPAQPHRAGR